MDVDSGMKWRRDGKVDKHLDKWSAGVVRWSWYGQHVEQEWITGYVEGKRGTNVE